MKTAAAYIRVSTDDQIEYSPESQIKAIRDFAKRNDYILPEEYIFADEGISGRRADKRPAFMEMIAIAKTKPKPFDTIIVWKFSRFARNREDSIVYKSMLKKQCKIDVVSVSEQLSEDKTSILIEALLEAMDEYYSINLGEEVKRGMNEKVSRGEPVSIPSFGYDIKDKQYIINEDEAKIVRMIFDDFANGTGYRELATKINAMGIRTKRGNRFENRTISYILNNPVYIGKIRWNPTGRTRRDFENKNIIIKDGHHEHIITEEQWNKAQERIKSLKVMYRRYDHQTTFTNMFQGLLKCSSCGSSLIKSGKGLQCEGYTKGRCKVSHSILYSKAEKIIIKGIEDIIKNENIFIEHKTAQPNVDNVLINNQIEREKLKLERIKNAYELGVDTIEEYKENKEKILKEISRLEKLRTPDKKLSQKDIRQIFKKKVQGLLVSLKNPDVSAQEKNKMLREFVSKIIFDRKSGEMQIHVYL